MASKNLFFSSLESQNIAGVYGVTRYKKGSPNKRLLVLIGSHGKEVETGLGAFEWFVQNQDSVTTSDFDVTFAIGNLTAARLYLATDDPEQKKLLRFTPGGRDMNRMPNDDELASSEVSECKRARALRSVIGKVDIVLDFHSTDAASVPGALGIVGATESVMALAKYLPVDEMITEVCNVQANQGTKTRPLSGLFVNDGGIAFEVECGKTGTRAASVIATEVLRSLAQQLGMVQGSPRQYDSPQEVYRMKASVMAPSTEYRVKDARLLIEKASVCEEEALLVKETVRRSRAGDVGGGTDFEFVRSPCDGLLFWVPSDLELTPVDVASEVFWIGEQV